MKGETMKKERFGPLSCGCWLALLAINIAVGGWSVHYILSIFKMNIPFWADALIGLFAAELSIPAAIIIAILRAFGIV